MVMMQNHNLIVKLMVSKFFLYVCTYVYTEYPNLHSTSEDVFLASEALLAGPHHLKGLFEGLNMVLGGKEDGL